jgi:deoxycytidylate deaminase
MGTQHHPHPPHHYRIFKVLFELALSNPGMIKNQGQVFKMAAAISYRRDILVTGINQIKSHPIMMHESYQKHRKQRQQQQKWYLHAEADAIRKCAWRNNNNNKHQHNHRCNDELLLSRCTMHVLRIKRDPNGTWMLGNARPCDGCMNLIREMKIQQVFWTVDGPILIHQNHNDDHKNNNNNNNNVQQRKPMAYPEQQQHSIFHHHTIASSTGQSS